MSPLLTEMLTLPTGIFTVLMGLIVLYWLFVIAGAIGVESLDFDLDGVLDGGVDGAVDGALDGALEGADGALDGAEGVGSGQGSHSFTWHVVHALALDKAPATVVLSVLVLWCWIASFLCMHFAARAELALPASVIASVTFLLSIGIAVPLTKRSVRPLGKLFETQEAASRADSVGVVCEVCTGRVTETFGQAEVRDGGAGLLIEVRCAEPNTLKRGDAALVVEYVAGEEAYQIESMDHFVASDGDGDLEAELAALDAIVRDAGVEAAETAPVQSRSSPRKS